jgi:Flp pilus assembly pilin Flp
MLRRFTQLVKSSISPRGEGQGLVEYGLILAGVSIAVLVAIYALGPQPIPLFNAVGASLRGSPVPVSVT